MNSSTYTVSDSLNNEDYEDNNLIIMNTDSNAIVKESCDEQSNKSVAANTMKTSTPVGTILKSLTKEYIVYEL